MSTEVTIRPFHIDDAPELYKAVLESIEELRPWMPWCHSQYSISEAEGWIQFQISAFHSGAEFQFAIISGESRLVGACGLNGINHDNQLANVGYWVRSSVTGHGIASAAARLLVNWAFQNTSLNRLEILVAVQNRPSLRVAAKSGAKWEGVLRGCLQLHGEFHDAVLFSILRNDG